MTPDDLEFIPREVRVRLDLVGVKLHLREWQALQLSERIELIENPCSSPGELSVYRSRLVELVRLRCGRDPDDIAAVKV